MQTVEIKGVGKAQFPDNMSRDDMRAFLRSKFSQPRAMSENLQDALTPKTSQAIPYNPTLVEKAGQKVSDALFNSGIVSDRFGAQRIGRNIASIGEFLPVIGDAAAGDEFGRAVATGDVLGAGLAAMGGIPIVGDALKKGGKAVKNKITFFHGGSYDGGVIDKTKGQRGGIGHFYGTTNKEAAENYSKSGFFDEDIGDLGGKVTEFEVNKDELLDLNNITTDDFIDSVGIEDIADVIRRETPDTWQELAMQADDLGVDIDEFIRSESGKNEVIDYIENIDPDSSFEGPALASVDFGPFLAANQELAEKLIKNKKGFMYSDSEIGGKSVALLDSYSINKQGINQ